MKKLGIYVQVPFCQTKCTYCNFHTGVVAKERFAPYVEAVCREIRGHSELFRAAGMELPNDWMDFEGVGRRIGAPPQRESGQAGAESAGFVVDTVYFGGGTPSLLEPRQLQRVLEAIRETFTTEFDEVTLDCHQTIQRDIKGSKLRIFAGCSHLTMNEKPREYVSVRPFLV